MQMKENKGKETMPITGFCELSGEGLSGTAVAGFDAGFDTDPLPLSCCFMNHFLISDDCVKQRDIDLNGTRRKQIYQEIRSNRRRCRNKP